MDFLRKYRPLYAPDGVTGMDSAPETPPVDPALAVDPQPDPEPAPAPKPTLPPSVIAEITALRAKNREKDAENDRLRREAADARSLAERLARGDKEPPAPTAHTPPATAADDSEIDRRAEYKLFVRDVEAMKTRAVQTFGPSFGDSIKVLDAIGAADDGFVGAVMDVDRANAHLILNELAQDAEKAVSLVRMTPNQRTAELTRMSMALAAKTDTKTDDPPAPAAKTAAAPAAKVSKAPAPPPAVTPSASKVVDWRADDSSDAEFSRGFDETMAKRLARR